MIFIELYDIFPAILMSINLHVILVSLTMVMSRYVDQLRQQPGTFYFYQLLITEIIITNYNHSIQGVQYKLVHDCY